MNQDDARNYMMALHAIVGFVPPMMMGLLVSNPIAVIIQAVANGQLRLVGADAQQQSGEAGPAKPKLVEG